VIWSHQSPVDQCFGQWAALAEVSAEVADEHGHGRADGAAVPDGVACTVGASARGAGSERKGQFIPRVAAQCSEWSRASIRGQGYCSCTMREHRTGQSLVCNLIAYRALHRWAMRRSSWPSVLSWESTEWSAAHRVDHGEDRLHGRALIARPLRSRIKRAECCGHDFGLTGVAILSRRGLFFQSEHCRLTTYASSSSTKIGGA
jgi:hypothetical protein